MTDKNIPAFLGRPQQDPNDVNKVIHNNGMTLRDYFAANIIIAYMNWALSQPAKENDNRITAANRYASVSYEIADAMLAARDK